MNETRVGYMSIDMLCDMLKEYIQVHTDNRMYTGDVKYLQLFIQYQNYLNT